jgi:hypothetical protein
VSQLRFLLSELFWLLRTFGSNSKSEEGEEKSRNEARGKIYSSQNIKLLKIIDITSKGKAIRGQD